MTISSLNSLIKLIHTKTIVLRDNYNPIVQFGDATDPSAYLNLGLGRDKGLQLVDVLITDPPYCLLERRRSGGDLRDPKKRQRKLEDQPTVPRFENVNAYKIFTEKWLSKCIQNVMKPNGTLIIWSNALGKAPIISIAKKNNYKLINEYLWAKKTTIGDKENSTKNEVLLRVYESALIFKNNDESVAKLLPSDRSPITSVITGYHDNDTADLHPCHKPLKCIEPLVREYSKPGDLLLDCFAGSGGILVAAKIIGERKILGMEILPDWVSRSNFALENTIPK